MPNPNTKRILQGLGAIVFGGIAGYLIAENGPQIVRSRVVEFNWALVWAIVGAAVCVAMLVLWIKWRQIFNIGLAIAAIIAAASLIGGLWNGVFVIGLLAVTLFLATRYSQELFGGDHFKAFRHHFDYWLTRNNGIVVVDEGKTVVPTTEGPHYGPRQVIVRPGNAVVMSSGTAISRICGPSFFQSKKFEYVRQVVPLVKRRRVLNMTNVLTFDQLPVDVHATFIFGIGVSDETSRGQNAKITHPDGSRSLTKDELELLRRLVTLAPEWENDMRTIVEGAIRNEVVHHDYDELLKLTNYQDLADIAAHKARKKANEIGGELLSIVIANIAPRAEVIEAIIDGERIRTRQTAEGQGFRNAINAISYAYRDALRAGMSLDDIHREASRHMMEHLAADPATKLVLTAPNQYEPVEPDGAATITLDAAVEPMTPSSSA